MRTCEHVEVEWLASNEGCWLFHKGRVTCETGKPLTAFSASLSQDHSQPALLRLSKCKGPRD